MSGWLQALSKVGPTELTALVSAAVALLSFLAQLRAFRIASNAAFRNLEERGKAISFWQAWLTAQAATCTPEQLEAAKAVARRNLDLLASNEVTTAPRQGPSLLRLVLLHRPQHGLAWLYRAPFFAAVVGGVYVLVSAGQPIFAGTANGRERLVYVGLVVFVALVVILLRLAALLLDGDLGTVRRSPQIAGSSSEGGGS